MPLSRIMDKSPKRHMPLSQIKWLNIALNKVHPCEIQYTPNVSKLSRMLHQVDDQLVNLCFGTVQNDLLLMSDDEYDYENSSQIGFHLSKKMPKLRKFSNRIVEMFRCADFLQNIEMMPLLETLVLGRDLAEVRGVDDILRGICNAKMILPSVRKLELIELYDPRLLDGVATAFPNVERLEMVRLLAKELKEEVRLDVGVVLEACRGLSALKHLKLTLSVYPAEMVDFIQGLLQGRELFQRLTTLEITTCRWKYVPRNLTEDEMVLFKQLLLVIDKMDRVTIANLDLNEESANIILDFIA
ncbi:uncharacterized protein LOC118438022 [Folsomia candida]|uniref:uncharacterized protein LOC118438022 n=1 Tax=Folsomia candida TaxID=158441 RepID=UPI001604C8C0|nr:uncharacterized protein LOC118438022 [Folsomia candida]